MPTHSRLIFEAAERLRFQGGNELRGNQAEERTLEESILLLLERSQEEFHVLMVDDESIYLNEVASLLAENALIGARIRLHAAASRDDALAIAREHVPLFVIQDLDLGKGKPDGIETTRALRAQGYAGKICIHSNRFVFGNLGLALDAGADTAVPKPMSRAHLLLFLKTALEEKLGVLPAEVQDSEDEDAESPSAPLRAVPGAPVSSGSDKMRVALVDDSRLVRNEWEDELEGEFAFEAFASTPAFWAACEADPHGVNRWKLVVTDFNFAPDDPADGASLARDLGAKGFEGIIALASGERISDPSVASLFDIHFGKEFPLARKVRECYDAARLTKARA